MNARDAILGRLRGNGATPSVVPRRGPQPSPCEAPVSRFVDRALRLSSTVSHVAMRSGLPDAVSAYLDECRLGNEIVCWPEFLDLNWIGSRLIAAVRPVEPDDRVGVTGVFCAIAETGTLMLLSGPQTPAATSLLPDTHIAVVDTTRIVATMEDAWALLRHERGLLPRAVNFVSGPSRTADIEQTVTLGAHGPARVHIVLVGDVDRRDGGARPSCATTG